MKPLRIITILIACIISSVLYAKDGTIKINKSIIYKGAVSNKRPDGQGSLTVYSRDNSKLPLLTVTGAFESSDNQSSHFSASNAVIAITDGLTVSAPKLTASISKVKDSESVKIYMPDCSISDREHTVDNAGELTISLIWTKQGNKEWEYIINDSGNGSNSSGKDINIKSTPRRGSISENFLPATEALARLNDQKLIQQVISFVIKQNSDLLKAPYMVELISVKEAIFDSGLKVKPGDYITEYSFPNGDFVKYNSVGICTSLNLTLTDGTISYNGRTLSITYSNGDRFKAKNLTGAGILPDDILKLQSLDNLKFNSGVFYNADKTSKTYLNGQIVGRSMAGGSISMGDNSTYVIKYDNGITFTGTDRNFIKNPDDFLNFNSVEDAILNNGKLTKAENSWDIYNNGIVIGGSWPLSDGGYVEYDNNNKPVSITQPNGAIVSGRFAINPVYSSNLKSSDFTLKDGTISKNGKITVCENGEIIPEYADDIRFIAQ